ncbi:MAG: VTT domain-containing protein [bacterium]
MKIIRKVYDWMGKKVSSPYADAWLVTLFFIEASVFIIPVDPLLILYCIQNHARSFYYATISTAASLVGGVFGYIIGFFLWDSVGVKLVTWIISEATFTSIIAKYRMYQTWAVLISGFTPVPYKAVTISAGFCQLPIVPFIFYSLIARGARFFLIAGIIRVWGAHVQYFIDRFFNYLVIAFVLLVVVSCFIFKG